MRPGFRTPSGPRSAREGRPLELVRVRRAQRNSGNESRNVGGRGRRRGGRGRGRSRGGSGSSSSSPRPFSFWAWIRQLLAPASQRDIRRPLSEQEARTLVDFGRHYGIQFESEGLLKLALTHRSYLSVTGQGPRESNERLEFLGDSILGLVTSEFLYRLHPDEHEGQLTKTKSLLVSKAILSRRALAMGLGRFVLMSHSEVESGGRQRLSILADAFEAVIGAIYLDQGFEAARGFIHRWLLKDTQAIASDERHANYKSHLQEYVQSTFHTHPVYRIRSEYGPDHSKHFMVDVMVGKRLLGSGKGRNKKEAEQAAARNALEEVGAMPSEVERAGREPRVEEDFSESAEREVPTRPERRSRDDGGTIRGTVEAAPRESESEPEDAGEEAGRPRRRGRRGGRGRRGRAEGELAAAVPESRETQEPTVPVRPPAKVRRGQPRMDPGPAVDPGVRPVRKARLSHLDDEIEEVGRPEGPIEGRLVDPFDWEAPQGDLPGADDSAGRSVRRSGAASHRPESIGSESAGRDEDEGPQESEPAGRPGTDEPRELEPLERPGTDEPRELEPLERPELQRQAEVERMGEALPPRSAPEDSASRFGRRTRPRPRSRR